MCFGKKRHVFCVTFALGALPPCWLWGGCVVTQCLDEGELEFRKGAAFSQGARSQTLKITISAKNLMMEETIFLSVALSNLVENAVCPGPWRCFFFFFFKTKKAANEMKRDKNRSSPLAELAFFHVWANDLYPGPSLSVRLGFMFCFICAQVRKDPF